MKSLFMLTPKVDIFIKKHIRFTSMWKYYFLVVLVSCLPACLSNGAGSRISQENVADKEASPTDPKVLEVVSLLRECPNWARIEKNDNATKEKILDQLSRISVYDIRIIRRAEISFMVETDAGSDASCVYLLNRYMFNAPEKELLGGYTYGGWIGAPYDEKENIFDGLWPFSYDSQGGVQLTGIFGGYNGPSYRPLQEFDYFYSKFGVRKMPGKK